MHEFEIVAMRSNVTTSSTMLALLFVFLDGPAAAVPPVGYYDSVDAANPSTLRVTLHNVIDDHTRFPYTSSSTDTWDILELAQQDPGNSTRIIDGYRNRSYAKIGGGVGPYNREHSWPKSYGFPQNSNNPENYPYTDCFQLFLCDSGYNSSRSNKPFRNCNAGCTEKVTDATNGQGGGSGIYPGNSNWTSGSFTQGTWETWIGRRGDIARAQFYLDVRYEGGTHGITGAAEPDLILTDNESLIAASNTGQNDPVAYMGILSVLLHCHLVDPVAHWFHNSNDGVFGVQGNRHPFTALRAAQPESHAHLRVAVAVRHAAEGHFGPTGFNQLLNHVPGDVRRNGKTQPLGHITAKVVAPVDHHIDADDFAAQIDERPTGISVIDGGIGLEQAALTAQLTVVGADDAAGDRVSEATQGAADGRHPLSPPQHGRVAKYGHPGP